eukprot:CAMPEP_0206218698 /NCGR_PEP_ID=MMETSP0047_2-20121206/3933_1 /ASSEMBLY_ACC=CAM_ASM_000192 /TAXON_ID=195065 /ORGANISM="Chroomonas mesostigmatica_cf, Strain CCMP1168" /LENGTH=141 /DNA_ID=CAMNT_0053641209 /DNA_START=722 /DNA_END=1143 /DNA_ORIENTATION=+
MALSSACTLAGPVSSGSFFSTTAFLFLAEPLAFLAARGSGTLCTWLSAGGADAVPVPTCALSLAADELLVSGAYGLADGTTSSRAAAVWMPTMKSEKTEWNPTSDLLTPDRISTLPPKTCAAFWSWPILRSSVLYGPSAIP